MHLAKEKFPYAPAVPQSAKFFVAYKKFLSRHLQLLWTVPPGKAGGYVLFGYGFAALGNRIPPAEISVNRQKRCKAEQRSCGLIFRIAVFNAGDKWGKRWPHCEPGFGIYFGWRSPATDSKDDGKYQGLCGEYP